QRAVKVGVRPRSEVAPEPCCDNWSSSLPLRRGGARSCLQSAFPAISSTRLMMQRRSFGSLIRTNALVSANPSEVARNSDKNAGEEFLSAGSASGLDVGA